MIFVTVGTSLWKFDRLIHEVDRIAPFLNEEIIMQIGSSEYTPKNVTFFSYLTNQEMEKYYDNATLIICHAGAGSIGNALSRNISLIVIPRKAGLELWDNHQFELAQELEKQNNCVVLYDDLSRLQTVIETILKMPKKMIGKRKNCLSLKISQYLSNISDLT